MGGKELMSTHWIMKSTNLCLSIVSAWKLVIKKEMSYPYIPKIVNRSLKTPPRVISEESAHAQGQACVSRR